LIRLNVEILTQVCRSDISFSLFVLYKKYVLEPLFSTQEHIISFILFHFVAEQIEYKHSLCYMWCRYGYKDARKETHQAFEQLLIESLEKFIRREAQERSLESDGNDDSDSEEDFPGSRVVIGPNGSMYSMGVPLLSEYRDLNKPIMEMNTSSDHTNHHPFDTSSDSSVSEAEQSLERELSFIHKAKESGVVYLLGHGDIRARKDSWFIKKLVINYFYTFLRKNCRRGIANLSVPQSHLMQVGMTYMV